MNSMQPRYGLFGVVCTFVLTTFTPARPVTLEEIRGHVEYLASDELAGRETGEPGCHEAEEYIAERFHAWGLEPLPGGDDLFVEFALRAGRFDKERSRATLHVGGRTYDGRLGREFRPFPFSGRGSVEGEIVFAGYGITAPEHDYDDYAGLDVTGKVVLVLRYEPAIDDPTSPFDGERHSPHAWFETKARNAREHGAGAMLLVTGPMHGDSDEDLSLQRGLALVAPDPADASDADGFIAVQISQDWAATMVSSSDFDLAELHEEVEAGIPASDLRLRDAHVELEVMSGDGRSFVARNVVAFLPGSDPLLRDEWIVVGGHHDHIGQRAGRGDRIFNGADDNASGTSLVLALARAYTERDARPRRSIVFATFSGEERGLLGSRALVEQELLPMRRVRLMMNFDMVGRNPHQPVRVFGDGVASGLRDIVESANQGVGVDLQFSGRAIPSNSDHASFYRADVPILAFFTGVHRDYHSVRDEADKLDYERMVEIARVADAALWRIADAGPEAFPRFIHHVAWLGVRLQVEEEDTGSRAHVTRVEPDSRGERAGLRAGDRVASMDGIDVHDPGDIGRRIRSVPPESRVRLGIERDGRLLDVEVERARAGFLGIQAAPVDAEDRERWNLPRTAGVRVRRVVPEGPAEASGLRRGDILVQVAGHDVAYEDIVDRLSAIGAGEEVQLEIVRAGDRLHLTVVLAARPDES
ncbi:MAG: M28 family peptidase [Candidatus Latescibacterota bacterium]|nr:MAG: M28 family peptidase [Candidatus Latescibacterota bacterium]